MCDHVSMCVCGGVFGLFCSKINSIKQKQTLKMNVRERDNEHN